MSRQLVPRPPVRSHSRMAQRRLLNRPGRIWKCHLYYLQPYRRFSFAHRNLLWRYALRTSNSTALNEAVTDFQVALTPATQTVAAGSPASYSLTVTPLGGFTGTIVAHLLRPAIACNCNAQTVTVSSGPASQTITIATVAPTTAMSVERRVALSGYTLLAAALFASDGCAGHFGSPPTSCCSS